MHDTIPQPVTGAERAARVTAATAALGDFRRFEDGSAVPGDWAMWAGRLAAELGSVLAAGAGLDATAEIRTASSGSEAEIRHGVTGFEAEIRRSSAHYGALSVAEIGTRGADFAHMCAVSREVLASALADAIEYRQPSGSCADCEAHPAGLCEPHAADLDRADDYAAIARELGVEEAGSC